MTSILKEFLSPNATSADPCVRVAKLKAIPVCGKDAAFSQRLINGKPAKYTILLSSSAQKKVIKLACRDCYTIEQVPPAKQKFAGWPNEYKTEFFVCSPCSYKSIKWIGCCPGCHAWDTLQEESESQATITIILTLQIG